MRDFCLPPSIHVWLCQDSRPEVVRLCRVFEELATLDDLSIPKYERNGRSQVQRLSVAFGMAMLDAHCMVFPANDVLD
jgi:hypothetical protein